MKLFFNPYFLMAVWLLGVVTVMVIISKKEKQRNGGNFFQTIIDDVKENPYYASCGYFLTFALSWFSVMNHLFFEKE